MAQLFKKNTPRKIFREKRQKHDIICEKCGRNDQVSFHPKGTAPVLCSRCHRRKIHEDKKRRKAKK